MRPFGAIKKTQRFYQIWYLLYVLLARKVFFAGASGSAAQKPPTPAKDQKRLAGRENGH
jgi:hypothetical protein